MSFKFPTNKEYQDFLDYQNSLNPFNRISGYTYQCIDQTKTPISEDKLFLMVMSQVFRQMMFNLPKELKTEVEKNLAEITDKEKKESYLSYILSQVTDLWPKITRGTINTLFEVTEELAILNEDKLYEDLEEYVTNFETAYKLAK